MTCIRIPNGIICVSPRGRLHVGNRYIWVDFHEYCGPIFYTKERGNEVEYIPNGDADPVWPEFGKWLSKYREKKALHNKQKTAKGGAS